jgi:hypothetical protein
MGDPAANVTAFYQDSHRRFLVGLAWAVVNVAGALLLWFLGRLRATLRQIDTGHGPMPALALAAGSVSVVPLWASFTVADALPGALRFNNNVSYEPGLDPHLDAVLDTVAYDLRSQAGIAAAVMIAATSQVVRRSDALPRWYARASVVFAVLLFFSPVLVIGPLLLLPVWTSVTAVLTANLQVPGLPTPETSAAPAPP